jgi:hypothetical protein
MPVRGPRNETLTASGGVCVCVWRGCPRTTFRTGLWSRSRWLRGCGSCNATAASSVVVSASVSLYHSSLSLLRDSPPPSSLRPQPPPSAHRGVAAAVRAGGAAVRAQGRALAPSPEDAGLRVLDGGRGPPISLSVPLSAPLCASVSSLGPVLLARSGWTRISTSSPSPAQRRPSVAPHRGSSSSTASTTRSATSW